MPLSLIGIYLKSGYEESLEAAVNTQLGNLSANVTTLSGNITTLSGNITTLSGTITALNDFTSVAVSSSVFTLDLTTYRNFTLNNTETSDKTLKIVNAPTASDTMLNVDVKLTFSATATVTYTGTITWSQAAAPNPTAAGTFILNLKSFDAGTSWLASFTGLY